jgi:hypothetical protein
MNQGTVQPQDTQDPPEPNDLNTNSPLTTASRADSHIAPSADSPADSFTGSPAAPLPNSIAVSSPNSTAVSSPSSSAASSPDSPADSSSDSPVDIYSILSKIPCLQSQGFMEAVNARIQKKALAKNWVKIVGPKLAEHTAPVMKDQKLVVIVNEQRWMAALQQIEGILSKKVNAFLKSSQPVTLELRLGKVSSFPRPHASSAIGSRELTSEQAVRIENLLCPIKNNEKLKQTLKNVLVRHCHHDQNFLEKN